MATFVDFGPDQEGSFYRVQGVDQPGPVNDYFLFRAETDPWGASYYAPVEVPQRYRLTVLAAIYAALGGDPLP
jgi:hypothetical protein